MKLGTLKEGGRDGCLVVVSRDNRFFVRAEGIAKTLQEALDDWDTISPKLQQLNDQLNTDSTIGSAVNLADFHAPLPRAYEWVDGSAYINHIVLVRKARNAAPPKTLKTDPLVYQGGSGIFLGPTEDIPLPKEEWGLDFESEICVVLGDTPQGVQPDNALQHVRLLMLANDLTYRNLIPPELAKGFGFFCSKPATAFSPFAITPDELGESWDQGRVDLTLETMLNGQVFGKVPAAREMHFSFRDLITHIARTRAFTAGTILGSGTVSTVQEGTGSSCLSERRMLEIIQDGRPSTAYMQAGDQVKIEMYNQAGRSLFGPIDQKVAAV
jgi:fumarylacetoacetate (FAA) hydrolase